MAQINPSLSALDNLLAAVNAANTGQTITDTQVTAGAGTVVGSPVAGRNTSVVLTAITEQGYTGTVTVTYARLPLNNSVVTPNFDFAGTIGQTAASVVAAVATTNGLVASELSLVDQTNDNAPVTGDISNSPASLTLVSATGSLLYVDGSTQLITFTWEAPQIALATAVATTALEGFDAAS